MASFHLKHDPTYLNKPKLSWPQQRWRLNQPTRSYFNFSPWTLRPWQQKSPIIPHKLLEPRLYRPNNNRDKSLGVGMTLNAHPGIHQESVREPYQFRETVANWVIIMLTPSDLRIDVSHRPTGSSNPTNANTCGYLGREVQPHSFIHSFGAAGNVSRSCGHS